MNNRVFIGLLCFLLMGSYAQANPQEIAPAKSQPPETWINVFVHGIMSIKPHVSVSNFARFITDDIQNSVYATTVELMRQDHIFFQNQAMQEIGLKSVDITKIEKGYASGAMAMVFETISQAVNQDVSIANHYYTYGWSGLLSQKRRYIDAKLLYVDLGKELETFKARGINPKIRLIGYSHGGNVLLNLGRVHQQETSLAHFQVHELILLGTPVQTETDHLVNDPMFEKIYHIYSRADRIQKLDFFSLNRFFSGRFFEPREGFELPNKLIQIQLRCTRPPRHASKKIKEFPPSNYNFKQKSVATGTARRFRNAAPGHSELWFFGWTPSNYRQHYPIHPLPTASLIPIIVREARDFVEKNLFDKPTLIDLRPHHGIIVVKNQASNRVLHVSKFLSEKDFTQIKEKVLAYQPDHYTLEKYNGAIQTAFNKAKKLRRQERIAHKHARKARLRAQRIQREAPTLEA